eukprot:2570446-Rhodomonas_salina.2
MRERGIAKEGASEGRRATDRQRVFGECRVSIGARWWSTRARRRCWSRCARGMCGICLEASRSPSGSGAPGLRRGLLLRAATSSNEWAADCDRAWAVLPCPWRPQLWSDRIFPLE